MKTIRWTCLCLLLFCTPAWAQNEFSSLEELMTGTEFDAAGLDKLSAEELENLNAWLRGHLAQEAAAMREAYVSEPDFEDRDEQTRGEFTAVIPGHFTGWTGDTVIKLKNGQVWKQTSGGSYRVNMENPVVVLYPAAFGAWRLRLEAAGPSIGVIRVK